MRAVESEKLLLAVGKQPLNDVLMIIQDTGLRPSEVWHSDREYRMRKAAKHSTRQARPRPHNVTYQLASVCAACCYFDVPDNPRAGYSPAARAIEQLWSQAVSGSPRASWPAPFACALLRSSCIWDDRLRGDRQSGKGDEGHAPHGRENFDTLQHPILDPVRKAIDQRNSRHKSRHSEVSVQ